MYLCKCNISQLSHNIFQLPVIDWSKYDIKIPEESFKLIYSDGTESSKKKHDTPKKESKISHGRWTTEEQKRLEELLQIYPPEPVEMRRFKKIADALGLEIPASNIIILFMIFR
jgi:hypothetical protein